MAIVINRIIVFGIEGFMAARSGIIAAISVASTQPGGGRGIALGTALVFTMQDVL
jgi:hypothetical protein